MQDNIFIRSYFSLFDFLIKNSYGIDPEFRKNIHTHLVVTLTTSILMWAYTILAYLCIEHPFAYIVGIVTSCVHLASAFLYRYFKNSFFISAIMLFAGVLHQSTFAFFSGGLASNVLIWFGIIPLLGGIMAGRRGAFFWALFVSLISLLFVFLEVVNFSYPNYLSKDATFYSQILILFGFIFLSTSSIFIYIVFKDITEANLIQERNKFKNLIYVLFHDMSGPITIIKNYLAQIKMQTKGIDSVERPVYRIENAISTMSEIISSVKKMQSYQDGKLQLSLEAVSFKQCIVECVKQFEEKIKEKNIILQQDFEGLDASLIKVDALLFKNQILSNILSNAIKFSSPGQVIFLRLSRISFHQIRLRIIDKGVGIPENILKELFNKSKKTTRKGTHGEEGSGYGLLIAKEFMEFFGGSIRITSISELVDIHNHGTIVDVDLLEFQPQK